MSLPQNELAEKALLANIFTTPETINEISEILAPQDFYEPKHELIYETIISLHENNQDYSPVSVVARLTTNGTLAQAGDIQYIREIVNPTDITALGADPIGYAYLVKENARLRELNLAAETIRQASQAGQGLSADEALEIAEAQIVEIVNKTTKDENTHNVLHLLPDVIQDIRNAANLPEGGLPGIPSGFPDLDRLTGGFKGGQMIIIAARPGVGKAVSTMALILTNSGFKKAGEITAEDKVFGIDGNLYNVVEAHPVETHNAYKVVFSDKSEFIVNDQHLWYTETHAARKSRHSQTKNIEHSRETILTEDKLNLIREALTKTSPEDTLSILGLARILGYPSANPTMLHIASKLNPAGVVVEKKKVYNRKTTGFAVTDSVNILLANAFFTEKHNDEVVTKRIAELVHSHDNRFMGAPTLARKVLGNECSPEDISFFTSFLRKQSARKNAPLSSQRVNIEVQARVSKTAPVPVYARQELLEAYYIHASSYKNDQRFKNSIGSTKTTREIMESLTIVSDSRSNHSVPVAKLLVLPERKLPVEPYVFGAWLGDGYSHSGNICGEDSDIFDYIQSRGYEPTVSRNKVVSRKNSANHKHNENFRIVRFPRLHEELKASNLLASTRHRIKTHGEVKHIPVEFLMSGVEQRRELLAGLMDTDGTAVKISALVQFANSNKRLIDDVVTLVASLGYRPSVSSKYPTINGVPSKALAYTVSWSTSDDVFRLPRKIEAHRLGAVGFSDERNAFRYIVDVIPLNEEMEMRCLSVDSPDNLFLVGRELVATHNSTLAVDFARSATFLAGKTALFFSLEMGAKELVARILSAEARVETSKLKIGALDETDWMNVREAQKKLEMGTFIIDATPKVTVSKIRSVATRQKLRPEGLDMIIVDYLQLMETVARRGGGGSRENEVSEMSRGIKLLAKELDVPIIILSQLNRKAEERQDGRPLVSDLRESGSLEQDADMVLLIHRPESSDQNNRPGEADLIIGKHRAGPMGKIPLTSMLSYSKFVPGQGAIAREPEMLGSGDGAEFATTDDETPW